MYLISFVRLKLKLLWHHESRVIVLKESLLVDSRVQVCNALVHPINAGLLGLFKALFRIYRYHQRVSYRGVETKVHALDKREKSKVKMWLIKIKKLRIENGHKIYFLCAAMHTDEKMEPKNLHQ